MRLGEFIELTLWYKHISKSELAKEMGASETSNEAPESYPVQFNDKIDEYLWKEHHILGGCCSSIESLKYSVAREVAEKLTDAFIEKALAFIRSCTTYDGLGYKAKCVNIEDFKNYMK